MLRKLYLDVMCFIAELLASVARPHSFWWELGRKWYIRGYYTPRAVGIGADFEWYSRDDFELAVDIGPFTLAAGRDFALRS